jgi:hypothetical protein
MYCGITIIFVKACGSDVVITRTVMLDMVHCLRYSFIHQWLCSLLLVSDLFFIFVIFFAKTVGLLGRVISPSQSRYLHTGQHKHRINAHTDTHALSGIRIHDPRVRTSECSSRLRPRGHCLEYNLLKIRSFSETGSVSIIRFEGGKILVICAR